jgi:AraC-like DNA-binding protein
MPASRSRFLRAARELDRHVQFAFVLPHYRRRDEHDIRRMPTARATIYFAANVRPTGAAGRGTTGLFCEGPHRKGFRVTHECDELVAVKVRAGSLRALLGLPAKELRDQTVPLDDVWGSRASLLAERMASASSAETRLALLQGELIRRSRHGGHDETVFAMLDLIERGAARTRVRDLIDRSGLSQRGLSKKFDEWVGLTPKQQLRINRMRSTVASLGDHAEDLAELATACGFYDQAHMTHEFQSLLGLSPGAFLRYRRAFSPVGTPASGRSAVPACEQRLYELVGQVSRWASVARRRV